MKFLIVLSTILFSTFNHQLEGTWQLVDYTGFTIFVGTDAFDSFSADKKLEAIDGMDYVLQNTTYSFRQDSIFYMNATPDFTVSEKKGKFLMRSDTIVVFESGKTNPTRLFISSINENVLKLKFVKEGGVLGPTEMIFERIK